ncbi:hypothetical protein K437DRAFT_53205 [Tilletiaria anomala UBC 951]|uniref:Uncharacterized protein n=1 Tax=Tilletiaria anomala (strain ATCC 24038 / CBS 436.72 / UBC 951) TaxID=1037660 RepID=A0A066V8H8_TILAU|nr:uncharacterized protein K437DRAFT_53205 [Tilletiaria anomala UBC 951]KDN36598.1 hypothetical protein K437DRAFT_53205 [Tilletiaria anomala UBC 951]
MYRPDFGSRLSKSIWTAASGEHVGGLLIVRSYDAAASMQRPKYVGKRTSRASLGGEWIRDNVQLGTEDAQDPHAPGGEEYDSAPTPASEPERTWDEAGNASGVNNLSCEPNPMRLMEQATRPFCDTSQQATKGKVAAAVKSQTMNADDTAALIEPDSTAGANNKGQSSLSSGFKNVVARRIRKIAESADERLAQQVPAFVEGSAGSDRKDACVSSKGDGAREEEVKKPLNTHRGQGRDETERVDSPARAEDLREHPLTDSDAEPLVLNLALHGIGQQLATSVEY